MKTYYDELSDVTRYLGKVGGASLETCTPDFDCIMNRIGKFKTINNEHAFLEVGTGTGSFTVLCNKHGIVCRGLDISFQLVEYARSLCLENDINPDVIELANIENVDLGEKLYDVIVANNIFEHVQCWEIALEKLFKALKPHGLLYFCSTNKFSLHSVEYDFPLYGWLPDAVRYRLRIFRQGPDIMKLGIDFNEFTYPGLRRFFKRTGFSKIYDAIDILDSSNLGHSNRRKEILLKELKLFRPLRSFALVFWPNTLFICIK